LFGQFEANQPGELACGSGHLAETPLCQSMVLIGRTTTDFACGRHAVIDRIGLNEVDASVWRAYINGCHE
jgi:hypothetical protein